MKKIANRRESPSERDHFAVVLEAIQSDFQVFGERLDQIEGGLSTKIDQLAADIEFIKNELVEIKLEMNELKRLLSRKADFKRLEELERRVKRIEAAIAKR